VDTTLSLTAYKEAQYDKLAKVLEDNLDMDLVDQILADSASSKEASR